MKRTLLMLLQIAGVFWVIVCAMITLPKVLLYNAGSAFGIGAIVGTLVAFLFLASPGLFAVKLLLSRKQQS